MNELRHLSCKERKWRTIWSGRSMSTQYRRKSPRDCIPEAAQTIRRGAEDLLCFYITVIRHVLEYTCPVRHLSLTAAQRKTLESLQQLEGDENNGSAAASLRLVSPDAVTEWCQPFTSKKLTTFLVIIFSHRPCPTVLQSPLPPSSPFQLILYPVFF